MNFSKLNLRIVIYGPDGVGKSTIISKIYNSLLKYVDDVEKRNWRPGFLPRLGKIIGKEPLVIKTKDGLILPRRNSGNLQFIRIIYYWFDFFVGYYLKDKSYLRGDRVILYDRGSLDTLVDPERYGLKNSKILKIFSNYIPGNSVSILFYDEPNAIYNRKAELSISEIEEQLKKWKIFVNNGMIDGVIKINADVDTIVRRTEHFIITKINIIKNENSFSIINQINWINSILGNNLFSIYSCQKNHKEIRLLNFKDGRGFIFPIKDNQKNSGLNFYSPQSILGRILKYFLKITNNKLFSKKIYIDIEKLQSSIIYTIISKLNIENLGFSILLGAPGPFRKPIIKFFSYSDDLEIYVKIGFNKITQNAINNEIKVLDYLNSKKLNYIKVPSLLLTGRYDNILYCAQSGYSGNKYSKLELGECHFKAIKELNALNMQRKILKKISIFNNIREGVININNEYFYHICQLTISHLLKSKFLFNTGINHGDFTPWNMIIINKKIYLYDWEFVQYDLPFGWDILRFYFQVNYYVKKNSINKIINSLLSRDNNADLIHEYFRSIYSNSNQFHELLLLYFLNELYIYSCPNSFDNEKALIFSKAINIILANV